MKITLKKAAELAREALDKANKTNVSNTLSISIYGKTSAVDAIARAQGVMDESISNIGDLIDAAFTIRQAIGDQNAGLGINTLMTKRAQVEALEKRLAAIVGDTSVYYDDVIDIDAVEAKISALKNRQDSYSESVAVRLLDGIQKDALTERLAALKRQKSDIRDTLAGINLTNHITLDERTVETLRRNLIV